MAAGQWGSSWRRSCEVAGESLDDDPTDPELIQPSPQSDLVHAAAHLMYIAAIEEMGLIRAFEQLVARFSKGIGEYPSDDWISNVLYCLHQGDEQLMPVEERRLLMAATLGIVLDGPPPGAGVNADFPRLFGQLVDELLKLREDRCRCRGGFDESTDAVEFVKLALEANIQAYMTGIALMQVRDLSRQVRLIKQVMQRPAVITQFACGHRDGLWAAVNNLNSGHYGSIGRLLALHQVALARNDIFNWIEPFEGSTASLDEAIEGAVTIRTAESWYAARPTGAPYAPYELPRRGAPAELGAAVKDRAATAV
jgi:hypothetical protein